MPDAHTLPAPRLEAGIGRFAESIAALTGWRRYAVAVTAGAVSILALPPFFLWPVLLVTLPVLIWLIEGAGPAAAHGLTLDRWALLRAAVVGWCFGLGYHVAGLYWLREAFLVTGGRLAWLWPLAVLGLPAYLAVYAGLAAVLVRMLPGEGLSRAATLAVGLGVGEWLRGHVFTGFPWNVLGMALTGPLPLMQTAGLIGIYGLTVLTVLVLAAPAMLLAKTTCSAAVHRVQAAMWLLAPLGLMWAYGTLKLQAAPPQMVDGIRVRLVQPSIPQLDKWLADKQPDIIRQHIELSMRDPSGRRDDLAGITHLIWPEAAMPYLPLERPQVLATLAEALPSSVHLMAGILRLERRDKSFPVGEPGSPFDPAFNSLVVLDGDARPVTVYDKAHLVPFGEYLPLQGFLEGLGLSALTRQRGGFTAGPAPRPLLSVGGLSGIGPLICYEAVFPGVSAGSAGRPRVLVNVTNDGWYGDTTGPRQHLHQARLRSVEEGIPLMRVANNGISAVFDASGRELARLDINVVGVIDTPLPGTIAAPLYARWGDLIFALLCGFVLAPVWHTLANRNKP